MTKNRLNRHNPILKNSFLESAAPGDEREIPWRSERIIEELLSTEQNSGVISCRDHAEKAWLHEGRVPRKGNFRRSLGMITPCRAEGERPTRGGFLQTRVSDDYISYLSNRTLALAVLHNLHYEATMGKESQKAFISWGAGVNSTAIIALYRLGILEGKPEIIFADTGGELPETYRYIDHISEILIEDGWEITTLHPLWLPELYAKRAAGKELYDVLWDMKTVPGIKWRFCTSEYKSRPVRRYARGRIKMLGICGDELKRMRDDVRAIYPLRDYTRDDCINLISEAGLPRAHKTSCYFCPFQSKSQWLSLFDDHRELWGEVVALENNSERWRIFSNGLSLEEQMDKWLAERELDTAQLTLNLSA